RPGCLRHVVGLGPIPPPLRGEKQDPVVRRGHKEVRDDVVLLEPGALYTLPAAFLAAVEIGFGALGVTGFGDGDDDILAGDQVLVVDVAIGRDDPGATVVAVLFGDLGEFVAHDRALPLR